MATRTIPTIGPNPLVININGNVTSYPAGATITTLTDAEASIIDNIYANMPKPATIPGTAGQVWTRFENGQGWGDLPEPTVVPVAEAVAPATMVTVVDAINAVIESLVDAGLMEEYVAPEPEAGE